MFNQNGIRFCCRQIRFDDDDQFKRIDANAELINWNERDLQSAMLTTKFQIHTPSLPSTLLLLTPPLSYSYSCISIYPRRIFFETSIIQYFVARHFIVFTPFSMSLVQNDFHILRISINLFDSNSNEIFSLISLTEWKY